MIEVFKTNVQTKDQASMLVASIRKAFVDHQANFDLDDCDKIDTEPVFPEYLTANS
jgi:hypothetical protein